MAMLQVGPMSKRFFIVTLAAIVTAPQSLAPTRLKAQSSDAVALRGIVSSQQEGQMEGVVVNARRAGANFTVSVVSDAQGKYNFPRTHLEPGTYTVTIRARGYDLDGSGIVEIAGGKPSTANLKLVKAKDLCRATQLPATASAFCIAARCSAE